MTEIVLNQDIDNLLDGTLDDLADLPEFKPFPPGLHLCTVKMEVKEIGDKKHKAVEVSLTAKETLETPAGSDEVVSPGQADKVLYFLTHDNPKVAEIGQGQFKEMMKAFAEHFGAKSNRELMADANGAEVAVATSLRKDKNDPAKKYLKIDAIKVA
jgi:hypothetical protein